MAKETIKVGTTEPVEEKLGVLATEETITDDSIAEISLILLLLVRKNIISRMEAMSCVSNNAA